MHPKALTESQRRLVEQNIGLAGYVAARFRGSGRAAGLEWEDLFSIACMGLVCGARAYDPTISRPSTYLYACCRGALLMELRRSRYKCRAGTVRSLDRVIRLGDDDADTFGESLPDKTNVEEEALANIIMQQILELATSRERIVAMMYARGSTQIEIAQALGTTQATVSRTMSSLRKKAHAVLAENAS